MRYSLLGFGLILFTCFSIAGCGSGGEATTISGSELQQYAEENADAMAEQAKIDDAEDAEEEDDE